MVVDVTATVGVGGAATTGILPTWPVVWPVVAEIQQVLLPVWTTHQVLSAFLPTSGRKEPWTKEAVLS